jgi:signal peptide peptidase SppA
MEAFTLQPGFDLPTRAVAEYFGVMSIYEPAMQSLVKRFNGLNLHAHLESPAAKAAEAKQHDSSRLQYRTADGIVVFAVNGPTMKYVSSMDEGTSTVQLRQQLSAARKDNAVRGAILFMDTPGGTVRGNTDLADEVARFAEAKPIYAFVEDMTASAGVSVASQATKRFANNATALYGSMGTYSVLVDESRRAEQLGVKVHVIRAGDHKGAGTPGSEVTDDQLAEAQRIVDTMNENYLALIARGTGLPLQSIRSMADGRIILAADAVKAGLLDGVQTFEETYAQLVAAVSPRAAAKNSAASLPPAAQEKVMVRANNTTAEDREEMAHFNELVSEYMARNQCGRQRAIHAVAKKHPEAHRRFLKATNPTTGARL